MKQRRADDRFVKMLVAGSDTGTEARTRGNGRLKLQQFVVDTTETQPRAVPAKGLTDLDDGLVLLDLGSGKLLVVEGAEVRYSTGGEGREDIIARVAADARFWRQERARRKRRQQLPELLMWLSEALNRAVAVQEVHAALMEYAARIVGGRLALVFARPAEGTRLELVRHPAFGEWNASLPATVFGRLQWPGSLAHDDVPQTGDDPLRDFAAIFTLSGAHSLLYAPIGESGLLAIVERRSHRTMTADERELLRSVGRQAHVALERIRLFAEVQELALTDALTGLGNRRRLEIILEQSVGRAARGEPLTLMMLDVVDFKRVNDQRGHLFGDELLREIAAALRIELRSADFAARFGGDEFVVVLPGSSAAGAHVLLGRLERRLGESVRFHAGIAEFEVGQSSGELLGAADRTLSQAKRDR